MLTARLFDGSGNLLGEAKLHPARAFPLLLKLKPQVESGDNPISTVSQARYFMRRGDNLSNIFDEITHWAQVIDRILPVEDHDAEAHNEVEGVHGTAPETPSG